MITISRIIGVFVFVVYIPPSSSLSMSMQTTQGRQQNQVLLFESKDSSRLKKAKLRLAEAQGVIPIGAASDYYDINDNNDAAMMVVPNLSKVREISWRVAEPVYLVVFLCCCCCCYQLLLIILMLLLMLFMLTVVLLKLLSMLLLIKLIII